MSSYPTEWGEAFTKCSREPPATDDDLARLTEDLRRPVSETEVATIIGRQTNPFPRTHPLAANWQPIDPSAWRLPDVPLPPSYLAFLRWSNGGSVTTGEMEFYFFGTGSLREMLLAYHLPQYMPLAIPLGLDGSCNFALFDARSPLANGEYPVVAAATSSLGFEEAVPLATTFEGFCRRRVRVEEAISAAPLVESPAERAEREARFAAQLATRERTRSLELADAAFKAGDFERASELLAPYRGSLSGSVEAKLRIAERKRRA